MYTCVGAPDGKTLSPHTHTRQKTNFGQNFLLEGASTEKGLLTGRRNPRNSFLCLGTGNKENRWKRSYLDVLC